MTMYDIGDVATVTTRLRDAAGQLVDADVVIAVTRPDGTALSPVPTVEDNGGLGLFKAAFALDMAGTWRYTWSASGAVTALDAGQLEVAAVGRVLVAGLDEFKAQLDRTDDSDDAELRLYLEAATSQIEYLVGPLSPVTYTERYEGAGAFVLRRGPVISVTSIKQVIGGRLRSTAIPAGDYYLDPVAGTVTMPAYPWRGEVEVAYRAGRTAVLPDVKLAGLIIAQHLWAVQNARFTINAPASDELAVAPGSGFAIPARALELLRPYMATSTVGGIA